MADRREFLLGLGTGTLGGTLGACTTRVHLDSKVEPPCTAEDLERLRACSLFVNSAYVSPYDRKSYVYTWGDHNHKSAPVVF